MTNGRGHASIYRPVEILTRHDEWWQCEGTTEGQREGYLHWRHEGGSHGVAPPGRWRWKGVKHTPTSRNPR